MNENGQIVGESETKSGQTHAFVWRHGKMTDLGTLGGASSRALAINDRGEIVGERASGKACPPRAVLWTLR